MRTFIRNMTKKMEGVYLRAQLLIEDKKGDITVNTIGGIIVGIIILGCLVVAANAFFGDGSGGFFKDMFTAAQKKLTNILKTAK